MLQLAFLPLMAAASLAEVNPKCLDMGTAQACNWNRGGPEPNGPAIPVAGQVIGIVDEKNFCIGLPDHDDPFIKDIVSSGQLPTILDGEGHMQVFCTGSYTTAGAKPMPPGGIQSAHVTKAKNAQGQLYFQVYGRLNCDILKINCTDATYNDGGQYDSVGWINYGKEPHSGVDPSLKDKYGFDNYVEQAGDGIYCMRVCQGGQQLTDACNVKDDTLGCQATMNIPWAAFDEPGFSYDDLTTGETHSSPGNPLVVQSLAGGASSTSSAAASSASASSSVSSASRAASSSAATSSSSSTVGKSNNSSGAMSMQTVAVAIFCVTVAALASVVVLF